MVDIHAVIRGYGEAGLWTSSCNGLAEHEGCFGNDCDVSLCDIGFDVSHLQGWVRTSVRHECEDFVRLCEDARPSVFDGMDAGQIGHDFWLTSRRHGTGFWDHGLGERGEFLTECAHTFSEADFFVSNGEIDY
jgi:hypothetical protein